MCHENFIDELEDYCARVGLKPSTVCFRALNDGKYVARHRRRLEVLARDADRIRKYMAEHPPRDDSAEDAT